MRFSRIAHAPLPPSRRQRRVVGHQPDLPLGVVGRALERNRQLVAGQRHCPHHLAAQLLQRRKHVFAPRADAVDAFVARLQPLAPFLPRLGAPRDAVAQPLVLQQLAVGLRVVAPVGEQLVAIKALAILFLVQRAARSVCARRLALQPSGTSPSLRASRSPFLAWVMGACTMLASTICPPRGDVAVLLQLQADGVKDGLRTEAALRQALLEGPQGAGVGDVERAVQAAEVLKAHPIQHLVLAVFVAEVVEGLDEEQAHHDLGGVRPAAASGAIGPRGQARSTWAATAPKSMSSSMAARLSTKPPSLAWRCSCTNRSAMG